MKHLYLLYKKIVLQNCLLIKGTFRKISCKNFSCKTLLIFLKNKDTLKAHKCQLSKYSHLFLKLN